MLDVKPPLKIPKRKLLSNLNNAVESTPIRNKSYYKDDESICNMQKDKNYKISKNM